MAGTISSLGKRGTFVVPARMREHLGWAEGDLILCEVDGATVKLRKVTAVPAEPPSPERRASFILNSAIDAEDYDRARGQVKGMGLDPDRIDHEPPPGVGRPRPRVS